MAQGSLRINVQVVGARLLAAQLRAVRIAALVAGFSARNHRNVTAILGILSMTAGAWMLCGAAIALAVFGGFTWITTIIAAELGAKPRAKETS